MLASNRTFRFSSNSGEGCVQSRVAACLTAANGTKCPPTMRPDPEHEGDDKGLKHPQVKIVPTKERFEDLAEKFIAWAQGRKPSPPTFVMVDPYGIRGVRLETLRKLLDFDRLEVLLTFMVRDPARFLKEPSYE